MKFKKFISLFALLFLAVFNINPNSLWSADDDIVWKYNVQNFDNGTLFKNDSVIFLAGIHSVFRDAISGKEIARYENLNLNNDRIYLFNEDKNYAQASLNNRKFYIYETEKYTIIDSIDNNAKDLGKLFGNQRTGVIVEAQKNKIRFWDLLQKKVIREIELKTEEFQTDNYFEYAGFGCNNELILTQEKTFKPDLGNSKTWYTTLNTTLFNIENGFDSLRNIGGGRRPLVSKTCKYFVMIRADLKNGIDIYDFNTFQKLYSIPCNGKIMSSVNFTSDDKYLIFAQGPDVNNLIIWDLINKTIVSEKPESSWRVLDITQDDKFAFCSIGNTFLKLQLKYTPNSVENDNNNDLYPNPVDNNLKIEYFVNKPLNFRFKITNLTGQTSLEKTLGFKNIGENIETIDVSNLPIGQYNLRLFSENEVINLNFIKGE